MAVVALTDATVLVNATNISTWVTSVTLDAQVNELDSETMGDTWEEVLPGLKSGSLKLELNNDFAASQLDSILWPLFGTVVTFEIRPTSAVVGTSNPKWTGSLLVSQLQPVNGNVGELSTESVTWPTSGTVTRATA